MSCRVKVVGMRSISMIPTSSRYHLACVRTAFASQTPAVDPFLRLGVPAGYDVDRNCQLRRRTKTNTVADRHGTEVAFDGDRQDHQDTRSAAAESYTPGNDDESSLEEQPATELYTQSPLRRALCPPSNRPDRNNVAPKQEDRNMRLHVIQRLLPHISTLSPFQAVEALGDGKQYQAQIHRSPR
ncbi:hypothetical protein C8F01DRAFT_1078503 [Mycena amicta]|nr:hypothetical protein C8F01DRAFT_1078503 [Mycena amicta]